MSWYPCQFEDCENNTRSDDKDFCDAHSPKREASIQRMVEALERYAYVGNDLVGIAREALEAWKKANE